MSLTGKRAKLPAFRTRAIGTNSHQITSGGTPNNANAVYGQLEAASSWAGKAHLADQVNNYPFLYAERTADLLNDGHVGRLNNPVTRACSRPFGTVSTLSTRPPRCLLFREPEVTNLKVSGSEYLASSDTFLAAVATVLDEYAVLATNKTVSVLQGGVPETDNTFSQIPLCEGLTFASSTVLTNGTTSGDEEVGVVDTTQWVGGSIYEIRIMYWGDWLFGLTVSSPSDPSPSAVVNDHYITQNIAVYPKYHARKVKTFFFDFGAFKEAVVGKAEMIRCTTALAAYGWDAPTIYTGNYASVQVPAFRNDFYGLAADIEAFFAST